MKHSDESIYNILPAALGPGVYKVLTEMSTRNRKITVMGSRVQAVRKINKLSAVCESSV
jgi:hypothetical protein